MAILFPLSEVTLSFTGGPPLKVIVLPSSMVNFPAEPAMLAIIIHSVPGDPASIMLGPRATPELKSALAAKMGLDQPLAVQILIFFGNLLRGDLGTDVFSSRPHLCGARGHGESWRGFYSLYPCRQFVAHGCESS